ncbi:hypothetical protein [Paenibacillus sinopodophylli]|uniref:hypothetical protein n=1 Tax=Paenibacillus sinopodophylli TaxID=1837342 RepID=UPI00110CF6E8|nr:hypothetical protein [Paenibacillus sinopodophylli]
MNRKKIIITTLLLITVVSTVVIGYFTFNIDSGSESQNKTEIQPVIDRFPRLEKIEKVYWQAEVIGDQNFDPSSYWMKGYIYLDKVIMESIENSYNWQDLNNLKPSFHLDIEQEQESQWLFSEDFNSYIKPSNFVGNFYLDVNNERFYFEVEE